MENEQKKSGNKLFIVLTVILVLLSGVLGWQLYDQKTQKDTVIAERDEVSAEKSQLEADLQELKGQYDEMEAANGTLDAELAAERAKIQELIQQLEASDKKVKNLSYVRSELNKLKQRYQQLEAKNDSLIAVTVELEGENKKVKGDLQEQKSMNQDLTNENMGLANQVAIGSILKAYEVSAIAVRDRGGKEKETDKAKRTDKIKTCFTLSENKITKKGMKNIYVRVEDPMGKILAEGMGASNEFELNGQKIGFSMKKEVMYENQAVPMCIYLSKGEDFAKGTYRITVYEDRAMIGETSFELK